MGLYQMKFWFRNTFNNWAKLFIRVNPDLLSFLAVLIAFITGLCIYYCPYNWGLLLAACLLIVLRMVFNTLDGMIAIAQGKKSMIGDVVNALPDRYSDVFTFLGLALCPLTYKTLGMIGIVSILLVSYSGMLAKAVGVSWQTQGPAGKVDRLVILVIGLILQYIFVIKNFKPPKLIGFNMSIFDWLMIWFILGAQITIFNRVKGMLREIRRKENAL
ncbi:MAG: CDP-alcohol phosphatidyltransferase family protein [Candidatus Omnitrophica bacterium]|nr:CDP-alcohol phosphatidyltransferase family protein [Candidatus Omnitrophota bacterium]